LVLKAARTGRRTDVDAAGEQMERALRCDGVALRGRQQCCVLWRCWLVACARRLL
jgi:hypothetical protein